jgi:hypothetical protein
VTEVAKARFPWRALALSVVAWLIPSSGHLLLGKRLRAFGYFAIVLTAFAVGLYLHGNLHRIVGGQPLSILATLGSMGSGIPYLYARFIAGYAGDPSGPTYEYGTIFLLSAGLMNLLLVLDVWDHASGRRESE